MDSRLLPIGVAAALAVAGLARRASGSPIRRSGPPVERDVFAKFKPPARIVFSPNGRRMSYSYASLPTILRTYSDDIYTAAATESKIWRTHLELRRVGTQEQFHEAEARLHRVLRQIATEIYGQDPQDPYVVLEGLLSHGGAYGKAKSPLFSRSFGVRIRTVGEDARGDRGRTWPPLHDRNDGTVKTDSLREEWQTFARVLDRLREAGFVADYLIPSWV